MNKIFIKLLLCVVLIAGIPVSAKSGDSPIEIFKLNNGQTVIIKEIHANPVVTIDTWVKTGSINENDENNGVSHFLEHLMFKGAKKYKYGEFSKIIEGKGGIFNAGTSKDFTHFYITIPSKDFETAIKLHADMMINSTVPEDKLNEERKVVIEEIRRSEDNTGNILFKNMIGMLFKTHPYRRTVLGPVENIENISREEILDYYHTYYVPQNMTTIVVGDIETKKVLNLLEDNFKANNCKKTKLPKFKKEKVSSEPQTKIKKGKYNFGYLYMGFKGVSIKDKKENFALDMASSILGGGKTSRLYRELKEKQNIVSSVGSGHFSLRDDSIFFISADFEPSNYEKVKIAIEKELEKFSATKVTEEELNRAKTLSERAFIYGSESGQGIASSLGYAMILDGKPDLYINQLKYIKSVTAKDIQKVVKKYVKPSSMALSVILPEETAEKTSRQEEKSFIEVNSVSPEKETVKNTTKSVLSNGLTLITNKNTFNDIVSLCVFVKGGKLADYPAGISNLLVGTLKKGTENRTYTEITEETANSGIMISPSVGSDYFQIRVKSTGADFDKAFDILADIVNNPVFPVEYVEKTKKDILQRIIKSRDKPLSKASENFKLAMYPNHPYGNVGKVLEKSVPSLTREQLLNFHKKIFIPQNMVVSVSGNINHDEIAEKIAASFPAKAGKKFTYKTGRTAEKLTENKTVFLKEDTSAAWMLKGWLLDDSGYKNTKNNAILRVIDSVLSGGMSSRLHTTFREKQGLSYAVGSTYSPKAEGSFFILYIGTAPKNVESVKSKLSEEIEKLKTEKVSEEELEAAKQKIIGGYLISRETNLQKACVFGRFETIDKGFGFTYDFPGIINSVTSEDVINTANKYFNSPYVFSIVAPEQ